MDSQFPNEKSNHVGRPVNGQQREHVKNTTHERVRVHRRRHAHALAHRERERERSA